MIQRSSIMGMMSMVMILAIALIAIFSITHLGDNNMTGMFVLAPDTPLEQINSTYSFLPLFEVKVDYSLEEYELIKSKARDLLQQCRGTDVALVNTCVADAITLMPSWAIGENEDFMYQFQVVGVKPIPFYDKDTKKLENKPLTYKFALDFSG